MLDQTERENILKKIRAMLELANPENGGTQGEIENAAKMAKMLMDKYNISMLDTMQEKKDDPKLFTEKTTTYATSKMKAWHWSLARAIDRIVGTRHFSMPSWGKSTRESKSKKKGNFRIASMTFFGLPNSVQIACDLFDKWVERIDLMGTTAVSEYITELEEEFAEEMLFQGVKQVRFLQGLGDRHPQTWRTAWLDGVVAGIHQALHDEEEAREDAERVAQGLKSLKGLSHKEKRDILRQEEEARQALEISGQIASGAIPVNTSTALALFSDKVDEAYTERSKNFRSVRSSSSGRSNWNAFSKGHSVGKNIRLNSKELKG